MSLRISIVLLLAFSSACASSGKTESYIKKSAVAFDEQSLPVELLEEVDRKSVVLFGEGHGIKNLPEFFFTVVDKLAQTRSVIVGLEFPKDVQKNIDQFFKDGDVSKLKSIAFFADPDYHSGRASVAMIELLQRLRLLKNVTPYCFDVPQSQSMAKDRETLMARNIIAKKQTSSDPIFVLTGNIHSRLVPGVPWDPKYPTMGSEILRLSNDLELNDVTNILFRYGQGSAWQCRKKENEIKCGEYPFGPSSSPYATEVNYSRYFLKEKTVNQGHYNTLFIREVKASFPYFN